MNVAKFLKALYRRRLLLIGIPAVTIIITFYLTRSLPDEYASKSRIATGIVDQSQQVLNKMDEQESKISQEFSNLTQMIQLNKILDQVSYMLILHDLTNKAPFRPPSKLLKTLSTQAKKHAIEVYKEHYQARTELSLWIPDEKGLYSVIQSMKYDREAITSKLSVYRVNNSDFIDVEFTADNAELAAFVVNALCKEFITYYTSIVKENQTKAVNFLDKLLKEKYAAMNVKINDLKNYKIQNHVLNLNEMAKSLYGQMADFETRRSIAEKDIIAYTAALKDIDNRFDPNDRRYLENTMVKINQDIIGAKQQLYMLNDEYVTSNFSDTYKQKIDSVRGVLSEEVAASSDKYITNPMATKQDLVTQKLMMEISLKLAQNSLGSINKELERLTNKFNGLVPHEAVIQSYDNAIDVASREYLEILDKFNETSMTSSYSVQLRQIQEAMPGSAAPSKKMVLVILSGIISFVFCILVLFILFYLDKSITEPKELVTKTALPVLGVLSKVKSAGLDLKELWEPSRTSENKAMAAFRDELRSIRFEVDNEMGAHKLLAITSLKEGEGKTFLSISLAYAYAMTEKKVLLVDGNFANPSITAIVKPVLFIEDYLTGKVAAPAATMHVISLLGNHGGGTALMEVAGQKTIVEKLAELKDRFDIIIIETTALSGQDRSKEWLQLTDKIVAVFEAGKTVTEEKTISVDYLAGLSNIFAGWVLNKFVK
jgi:uncharacterized protein involved in exopolysaccharide biosynthesis/Mrp family chromosome partitioning ATPase